MQRRVGRVVSVLPDQHNKVPACPRQQLRAILNPGNMSLLGGLYHAVKHCRIFLFVYFGLSLV